MPLDLSDSAGLHAVAARFQRGSSGSPSPRLTRGSVDAMRAKNYPRAMADLTARRAAFRALHEQGCFVIPNPWDRGSAVFLERLGFRALATTSAGFAFSRARPDTVDALPRDAVLAHVADIVAATDLPVSADFQCGYSDDAAGVAESVKLCVEAGVAGLSIEDATGDPERPLFDLPSAIERIKAARRAIDASQSGVLLTGRAECFLTGHPSPLDESIRRLRAYADAGADVLYAPGLRDREAIRAVVEAVAPKPVNVLVGAPMGLSVSDLAALGVRRVSVGGALARVAWTAFAAAAREIAEAGEFSGFEGILSTAEVSRWFSPSRPPPAVQREAGRNDG
jgi:2-methylisocitrate lyase-like PEP mutase family enzyme